ncbi:MAG: hypothetical protein J7M38_02390, partial [Armatimonadetes bacterium]|nr:hypothetical protein [Armatimonadota bacterium]
MKAHVSLIAGAILSMRIFMAAVSIIVLGGPVCAAGGLSREVILKADFERTAPGELPEGWRPFSGPEGIEVSAERAHDGTHSLMMVDDSDTRGVGLRSRKVEVTPGEYYSVEGWYWAESGDNMSLYIEFWDAEGKRIEDSVHSFGVSGRGAWARATGVARAPEGAVAVTTLPYSHSQNIATGWWDDITIAHGIPIMFDRTPRPPAPVEHPCGLYREADIERALANIERHQWAAEMLEAIKRNTAAWMDIPDDEIADWIPKGTPFRVCDCPNCGAPWGVSPFRSLGDGRFKCRRCGTVYPNPDFPETQTEVFLNPLGEEEVNHFYQDEAGKKYRLSGHSPYRRILKLNRLGYLGRAY